MKGGYTGKILRVNLTSKSISRIETEKYMEFGGGHGIGSAIFLISLRNSCRLTRSIRGTLSS